jgi:hypothetical protein
MYILWDVYYVLALWLIIMPLCDSSLYKKKKKMGRHKMHLEKIGYIRGKRVACCHTKA